MYLSSYVLFVLCLQISSSVFGISQTPKYVNGWPIIGSSSTSANSSFVRLEWQGSKSITLHMPGGVECKCSIWTQTTSIHHSLRVCCCFYFLFLLLCYLLMFNYCFKFMIQVLLEFLQAFLIMQYINLSWIVRHFQEWGEN